MMRLPMSAAAIGLLRALVARSGVAKDRILLMEWTSRDWQSLTFIGERHKARIRICGPEAREVTGRIVTGLDDAEFNIPGHIVADIGLVCEPEHADDGSTILNIEALTVAE